MCFRAGQGSSCWHFTIVVSVFLPVRWSIQCFPFHIGVKTSVTTVTTVKPRVAALCITVDPPTQLAAFIRWAKVTACRPNASSLIGVPSDGADSYCEGIASLIRVLILVWRGGQHRSTDRPTESQPEGNARRETKDLTATDLELAERELSRTDSLAASIPPNFTSASRRASSGFMPARMLSSMCTSRPER